MRRIAIAAMPGQRRVSGKQRRRGRERTPQHLRFGFWGHALRIAPSITSTARSTTTALYGYPPFEP